jgi:hypothetical protein
MDIIKLLRESTTSDLDAFILGELAADMIEQLRLANTDLQMHYDYVKTEHDKLKAEVQRLRGSLAFISILQPFNDQSWQSHAKFINAYALDELKEKTLYDQTPRLDDRGDNLDGN